ncbi:hypothetical protein [Streptomyces sp. NPDC058295]|uniref:hypothetical protein n=1 Tax=Streptomyces sp. NPDC058295 TaxID=3346431 RepID=UPI0036E221FB
MRFLNDPQSSIRKNTSAELAPGFDALAANLEAADLYWVQEDMAALSMHAGEKLAAASWATTDRPSPSGLLYWQGGIGHMDGYGVQIPVEACAWGPHQGEMMLWLLMSRDRLAAVTEANKQFTLLTDEIPPLVPVFGSTIPITADPLSMLELESELPVPIVSALASAWLLMQQPLLIDRTRERADKPTARAYTRDGLPAPDVTVVDLRRQYTPQDRDPDAGSDGRRYRHRWIVSGHWREYRSDRYSAETRASKQWIPSHVKGPDGAPLLSTEKVNVWRR